MFSYFFVADHFPFLLFFQQKKIQRILFFRPNPHVDRFAIFAIFSPRSMADLLVPFPPVTLEAPRFSSPTFSLHGKGRPGVLLGST